jgi:CBS domain-containing protein
MRVREAMTNRVESCSPETNLATVAGLMWEKDCGVLPVLDVSGKIIGMITDRDICIAVASRNRLASEIRVSDVMSSHVYSCRPDDDIEDALKIMEEGNVLRLPVISDDGELQGVLTIYSVVLHAGNDKSKKSHSLSSERVVGTLKRISGSRFKKPSEERATAQGARA